VEAAHVRLPDGVAAADWRGRRLNSAQRRVKLLRRCLQQPPPEQLCVPLAQSLGLQPARPLGSCVGAIGGHNVQWWRAEQIRQPCDEQPAGDAERKRPRHRVNVEVAAAPAVSQQVVHRRFIIQEDMESIRYRDDVADERRAWASYGGLPWALFRSVGLVGSAPALEYGCLERRQQQ